MKPLPLDALRAIFLYVPLIACTTLILIRKPGSRELAGAFLAFLWAMPSLLLLDLAAHHLGWWRMTAPAGLFPIATDVWIGWAVAWGPVPVLAAWRRPIVALLVAWWVDITMMPLALNLVDLRREWLIGELAALTCVLLPAVFFARLTIEERFLKVRVTMQMLVFGAWTLWLLPMGVMKARPPSRDALWLLLPLLAPLGVVAASAVQEFARRGGGTPLPYDPPRRLVTSGPYAYVSNPMQLSMTLVLLGLSVILWSPYLALGAIIAIAYSVGLAGWHETVQLVERFGEPWQAYRREIRAWRPRVHPYVAQPSTIYVAFTCMVCSPVGRWISRHNPIGLCIEPAESLLHPPRRLMYVPPDGGPPDFGVAAFGRALEHIHLGWAMIGFVLRLPVLRPIVQLIVDASGGGPRDIQSQVAPGSACDNALAS